MMLTLKKSIVKMKGPILTDYSQLRPYMELEGYIIAVKETIVVVAFFNGVQVTIFAIQFFFKLLSIFSKFALHF